MNCYFVMNKNCRQAISVLCAVSLNLVVVPFGALAQSQEQTAVQALGASPAQIGQQLAEAKTAVQLKPDDAHTRYAYAQALRRSGKYRQAAGEYLDAADLDPTMYVAFHQIAQIKCDPAQIDEALTYLLELDEDHPNDLMLKIALSELLERKAEYYKAARALIDVSYAGKLPPKIAPRVKMRIHYLLAKARQEQSEGRDFASAPTNGSAVEEDESGGLPPPLPADMPTSPLKSSSSQAGRTSEGTGHSTLLP
jgi:tetratricopeptide (TPR) repeat protein